MIENMFIGRPPGNYDRLLDFSQAVSGSSFFAPSATFLESVGVKESSTTVPADRSSPLKDMLLKEIGMFQLKRVYEEAGTHDGKRFLVERLWPRGIRKANLRIDGWEKDAGPSTELRKWFNHDPDKWEEFQRKYFSELDTRPEAWEPLLKAARHGTITLLYRSHDTEHNNAVALKRYLETELTHRAGHL